MDKLKQSVEYIKLNSRDNQNTIPKEVAGVVLNEMIKEGLIQRFEYTHELAWNVMKDYAEYQGNSNIGGSRVASREAFKLQLVSNGDVWMDMIGSRNKTSHTYNEEITNEIYVKILNEYYQAFLDFIIVMQEKKRVFKSCLTG
jgi:nucleotidyltransferase substrate binding protein (TIGR01987 family)